eukprot:4332324-Alexandrium_andersonii.AAC.1
MAQALLPTPRWLRGLRALGLGVRRRHRHDDAEPDRLEALREGGDGLEEGHGDAETLRVLHEAREHLHERQLPRLRGRTEVPHARHV